MHLNYGAQSVRQITSIGSEKRKEHVNIFYRQIAEFLNVKADDLYKFGDYLTENTMLFKSTDHSPNVA